MALVNRSFSLNITPGAIPQVVNVSGYDENREYTVTLIDEGGTYEIPSGTTAAIEGTIGDSGFSETASVSGNTITFELTESMTAKAGDAWCKIKLVKDSKPIQTCAFILAVDRAGVESDTVIGAPGFEEQIREAAGAWLEDQGFSSPTIGVAEITGGHRVTVTDYQHTDSFDVMDGEDGDTVAVDTTLTHSGEAADAKATGDRLTALETAQIETDDTLEVSGAAADAAVVGNRFAEINPYIEYIKELMIEEQMRDFDVSEIDSEWQQNTRDALKQTLMLGGGYVHFIVATDTHISSPPSTSFATKAKPILDALMGTGKYDKFINLGDTGYLDQAISLGYFWGVENGDCLFTLGNHDVETGLSGFEEQVFSYIKDIPNVVFKEQEGENLRNYYYDVPSHKLRILFVDSNNTDIEDAFFRNAITSMGSGWKYFAFSHHPTALPQQFLRMQYEMPQNYLGKVGGHTHSDGLNMQFGMLYQTILCALYLTVVSVNPATNDVRFYRIGVDSPASETSVLGGIVNHKFGYTVDQTYKPEKLDGYVYSTSFNSVTEKADAKLLTEIYKATGNGAFLSKTGGVMYWSGGNDRFQSYLSNAWDSNNGHARLSDTTYTQFLDTRLTHIGSNYYQISVGINDTVQFYDTDEIPDGFNEAIGTEWALGTFGQTGGVKTSTTTKYNKQCIKVKPNTTYRFTQPSGTNIGTFTYCTSPKWGSNWQRFIVSGVESNSIEFQTNSTAKVVYISVSNPADDMSTCTFEEVST